MEMDGFDGQRDIVLGTCSATQQAGYLLGSEVVELTKMEAVPHRFKKHSRVPTAALL
jgi:hypothetical protein